MIIMIIMIMMIIMIIIHTSNSIRMLLAARADPDARSLPLRRTPLHAAVVHRSSGGTTCLTPPVSRRFFKSGERRRKFD